MLMSYRSCLSLKDSYDESWISNLQLEVAELAKIQSLFCFLELINLLHGYLDQSSYRT
jgi:hypothetical protein